MKSVQENPSEFLTKDQIIFMNSYDKIVPINFDTFAAKALGLKTYSIENKLKTNPIDIYKKDEGLKTPIKWNLSERDYEPAFPFYFEESFENREKYFQNRWWQF